VQFVADGRAILTRRHVSGQSILWELPNETRDLAELTLLSNVFSGLHQTPEDLQIAYEKLRKQHPNDLQVSVDDIITWHRRNAEASEAAQAWSAAVFHWNLLIGLKPGEQTFHHRLDRARDHLNRTNASPSQSICRSKP
jgi:hypothetical protein